MIKLNREPTVRRLAESLLGEAVDAPVSAIVQHCLTKVRNWTEDLPLAKSIDEFQSVLCSRMRVVIEEVWCDGDVDELIKKYTSKKEFVFASLHDQLRDSETYGMLIERRKVPSTAADRFVAIVDCRGRKAQRRFFTRWHEIAHVLTLDRQLEFVLFRSADEAKCPLESVTDIVAGKVGFYGPLFDPILMSELTRSGRLSFASIERIREEFSTEASFQATLNACIARAPYPIIWVEAGLAYKRDEERILMKTSLKDKPTPKLRVRRTISSHGARKSGLFIPRNMRVPESSSLYKRFFASTESVISLGSDHAIEQLGAWTFSSGESLADIEVHVETRMINGHVLALISPCEDSTYSGTQ